MKRDILAKMDAWDADAFRKPLILMGARQVGKTWLMQEFARTRYAGRTVAVNLMDDDALRTQIEESKVDAEGLLRLIELSAGRRIAPDKTLVLIDEIQESPKALASLKFFAERMPRLAVIAAGSLLGLSVRRGSRANVGKDVRGSFPVGKVDFLDVRPMSFFEFLDAMGEGMRLDVLCGRDVEMANVQHAEFVRLLKTYLFTGGMPEAVAAFAATGDHFRVRRIQSAILRAYDKDFEKHAPSPYLLAKLRLLWNNVPAQLAKDSKKFIYTALKQGARAREYEEALQWLDDAGMIHVLRRVDPPGMPLKAYEDFSAFKVFAHDVGLLGALSELPPKTLLDGSAIFTNFKGALTEQYVLQELLAAGAAPRYWSSGKGNAEVDFVLQGDREVFPLEAKAVTNLNAKSLAIYRKAFNPSKSFRTSLAKWRPDGPLADVPLYAVSLIADEIRG